MNSMKSGMTGLSQLTGRLRRIRKAAPSIARAGVRAALGRMAAAVKAEAPGTIGLEVGFRLTESGPVLVRGKVGLGVQPHRSDRRHGHFLALGTRYIRARRFVRSAFQRALPAAIGAMRRSSKRRLEKVAESK